jgi:tRNA U38,U39,U40 pseudouridine synthase TruA
MIRESQIKRQHLNKPKIVGAINSNLPADLRVYTYKFVSKSFNVRTKGDARTYEYCMPIFAYKRAAEAKQKDEEGGNSAAAEA